MPTERRIVPRNDKNGRPYRTGRSTIRRTISSPDPPSRDERLPTVQRVSRLVPAAAAEIAPVAGVADPGRARCHVRSGVTDPGHTPGPHPRRAVIS